MLLFVLLFFTFVVLIKEIAIVLLIFPLILSSSQARRYGGLMASLCAVLVSSIWYWVSQPEYITVDAWLASSLMFLCVGIGINYILFFQEKFIVKSQQAQQIQQNWDDVNHRVAAFRSSFPDYTLIFDEQGKYVDAFSQAIDETDRIYLIGKSIKEVPKFITPETAEQVLETIQATIQTGESQKLEYQATISVKTVTSWMQGHTSILPTRDHDTSHVIWVARDITKRKELERSLEKVQQIAQTGIWETDVLTNYVTWSDEVYRIYGVTRDEFDHTVEFATSRMHPDDLKEFQEKIAKGINPYPTEYRIFRPDNSIGTVYAVGDHIYDEHNRLIKRIGMIQDVTERRQTEQDRIQLQIAKQRTSALRNLITDVTHDLMTPVTVIKTSLYLLKSASTDEHIMKHLDKVDTHINILQKIVESLLTVSYLDDLDFDNLALRSSDIMMLLRSLAQQYQSMMSNKNQTLTMSLPDHAILMRYDHDHLQQAISNLLQNAMQYTPEGGHIQLTVTAHENSITIVIRDNGIGISEGHLHHIFEPFYRVEKHRPVTEGNSGLGLRITKLIVELHGGQITVDSTPNEGSTFELTLPIIQIEAKAYHKRGK